MCPISGLMQFLIVIVTLLLLFESMVVHALKITFEPKNATIHMYDTVSVNYTITDGSPDIIELYSENTNIAVVKKNYYINSPDPMIGSFNLTGNFLGKTKIKCKVLKTDEILEDEFPVIVTRKQRTIDIIFTSSVATLVSIIYINFGCALNWGSLRTNLKRPIGPVIGFCGQFIIMPILSFVLGKLLFPNEPEMQLGMFFTGVSPAGGASNVWTAILDGNIDLSITMTTISTLAAFAMIPLWLFTLGKHIFDKADMVVPYSQISTYAIALIVPLGIGFLLSRYCKRVAQFLTRILKGFSGLLIFFIVVFAIVTNLYLFKLFSWKIVLAGMGLPYLGFIFAYILAKVLRQSEPDTLAIAIETSIQNTGIAIFLLRFGLPQPDADLTTVAPVSVAIMTPLPFILMLIYKKIKGRCSSKQKNLITGSELLDNKTDNNYCNKEGETYIMTIS